MKAQPGESTTPTHGLAEALGNRKWEIRQSNYALHQSCGLVLARS